jgi:hypothetical protein
MRLMFNRVLVAPFVLGDRLGQFMHGTFGHAAADFDHPVGFSYWS